MSQEILVTGGAGYIGSHTLRALVSAGFAPVCFDDLSTGFRSFAGAAPFCRGDLAAQRDLELAFAAHTFAAVVHFASHALVEESYRNPHKYYHDNILNALNLLQAMGRHGCRLLVFSSSCATYGIPPAVPMDESTPLRPVNPYGATKMFIERILADYEAAHGVRSVSLRYFNAAGAAHDGTIGELHRPETHLIPRLLDIALAQDGVAEIYGDDYPTADGTCIRDYIHVADLAAAHLAALEHLLAGGQSTALNLGSGRGHSVREVVAQVARTTGIRIPEVVKARRSGDPPALVADARKAGLVLSWRTRHSSLAEIVETAWNWHRNGRQDLQSAPS